MEIKLHDIGEGITEGEINHLFVSVGDHVTIDQPLVEVQTDKVTAELSSPISGKIEKILVHVGDVIKVGTTLIVVDDGKDLTHRSQPKAKGPKRILAAPHTRKLAREHQINLDDIEGTGPIGRITDSDVLTYVEQLKNKSKPQSSDDQQNNDDTIPFRGRRKQIAKKMTTSMFTIPHVTHFDEADMTNLLSLKDQLKAYHGQEMINVSLAAFFIKVITQALKEFPIFNSKLDEEHEVIRLEKSYHIGFATDTPDGLIVPVIKDADKKSLIDIHHEMKELIEKGRHDKLTASEIKGSTFTISNVGPLGSTGATPIVNYPEVALMAFHKTKKMPVVSDEDQIVIRSIMTVSMSFDHRIADGAKAVAFTNSVINKLENPYTMLVNMT